MFKYSRKSTTLSRRVFILDTECNDLIFTNFKLV
ncbi:hypothetical protein T12_4963 [Trichinella patagoniensis]|uniref:Uncharacterized protein n=1 Tax=Trichinella patagoniensis TaxID=990121 RepID=A0A0V0XL70_9BILA|nr:hypothetical protein T12_4963 [Trichinella patagoniensis]